MTKAELYWMELAEQLVLGALANESRSGIQEVGKLLSKMTQRDWEAIRRGEKWGRARSWPLGQHEARNVLREMRFKEMEEFANHWGYLLSDLMAWAVGHSDIDAEALSPLHNLYEIAGKLSQEGGTR
jgi:hypothetical protein